MGNRAILRVVVALLAVSGAAGAARAATTIEDVAKFLEAYVAERSAEGWFVVRDDRAGTDLRLKLDRVHRERLARTEQGTYFVCADFRTEGGKLYDLDFWVQERDGELTVTETTVHKEEGKPRYTWYKDGEVWKRRPAE